MSEISIVEDTTNVSTTNEQINVQASECFTLSTWGAINGTLSEQTDLQNELDLKADISNVLELDNTTIFTPDADYEPATKKYVDDNVVAGAVSSVFGRSGVVIAVSGDYDASEVTNAFDKTVNDTDDISEGLTNLYDKTVAFTGGTNVTIGGTYPNFTLTDNSASSSSLTTHTSDGTIHFTQSAISIPASQISDFDTEVSNNTSVAANTSKVTNVSTNLSEGTNTNTTVDVNSSDGTNATILAASTSRAGVMTKAKFDEVVVNNSKNTNVSTNLSLGTVTSTTMNVNSSDGTNATLISADTDDAGLLTAAKFDEIVANSIKVTNQTHTGDVTGSIALTIANSAVDIIMLSASGTPDATTFLRGDNTWTVPAGTGDVSKVGTPLDNQVGVWTGDGTIEGTTGFTYNGTVLDLTGNITLTGTVDGIDIGVDVAANTSKITNATHSGDVTGSTALTISNDAVDIVMLSATGTPSSSTFLRGDNTWSAPAGAGTVTSVDAGNGLDFISITGSGDVTLGTPGTTTASTSNAVTATSHTHQLDESGISITASQVSNFDTEVSNNSSVAANTSKITNANHTGDATGATALTLATVNSNVGSFTAADITVNAKGLITAASNGSGGGGTSTPFEQSFVATSSQTNFTLSNTPAAAWVWVEGVAQDASTWSISGNDIVLSTPATLDDSVEVYYLTSVSVSTNFTDNFTAGESVVDGDLCYYKSDGKFWKADATVEATSIGRLAIAKATISADASGLFLVEGEHTTTGLTTGSIYYISETTGEFTLTKPTTSTSIVRVVGIAISTTILLFNPDYTWVENA